MLLLTGRITLRCWIDSVSLLLVAIGLMVSVDVERGRLRRVGRIIMEGRRTIQFAVMVNITR